MTAPFVLMHLSGDDACGQPAYLLRRRPEPGDRALSTDVLELSGQPVGAMAPMLCGSCGQWLEAPLNTGDVVPRETSA